MAVTASVQPELGRIVYAGSDFRIRFSSVFSKKAWIILCKTDPDLIFGWPGQGLAKRIWSESKPVSRNHLARFLAGRKRTATSFPLSDSVFVLPQTSRIILCKTSSDPDGLVLADCVRFWPNRSGPEAVSYTHLTLPTMAVV